MSRTARLGAFIFAALLIFAAMIFLIGERQFLFSRTYQLKAPFENVAGLEEGAPVRAGGLRVGTVKDIRLPQQPGEKITVEMELEQSTQAVIKKDSVAEIETEGLLGSKYLAISFGSAQAEALRDGDLIQSRPPLDYADIARKASATIDTAKEAIDSAKAAIDSSHIAIGNVNEATDDMKSITSKVNNGQGTIGALINDREAYQNLNDTTASLRETVAQAKVGVVSFQENMEALKHNFFFKGFFKDRGYFDSSELTKYAVEKLPDGTPSKKFALTGKDLFDKPDSAKLDKEKLLNEVGKYLESNSFGLAVIAVHTGPTGTKEDNLTLSRARAMVVRQYLLEKFNVDEGRIRTLGLGESAEFGAGQEGRVEILVYANDVRGRVAEATNK